MGNPLCQGNPSISRQILLGEILLFDIICPDSINMLVIRLSLFAAFALDVFRGFFWYWNVCTRRRTNNRKLNITPKWKGKCEHIWALSIEHHFPNLQFCVPWLISPHREYTRLCQGVPDWWTIVIHPNPWNMRPLQKLLSTTALYATFDVRKSCTR